MQGSGLSGGLFWHLRSRQRRKTWRPTSAAIAAWLEEAPGRGEELLLIGPSAGWMLPGRWLAGFSAIEAVDLDPLAPWLFDHHHGARLRAAGTHWRFHRADGLRGLPGLLQRFPAARVLFDNVLGQQRFRETDLVALEARLAALGEMLQGRAWGSVHDLYSGPVGLGRAPTEPLAEIAAVASPDGPCCTGQDAAATQAWLLELAGAEGEWTDHLTSAIFAAGQPCRLIHWPFAPGYAHWLQAAWVDGGRR